MSGFSNPVANAAGTLIRTLLKSLGFVAGVTGWQITRSGNAEFNAGTFRGSITVVGPNGSKILIETGAGYPKITLLSVDGTNDAFINLTGANDQANLGINGGKFDPGDGTIRRVRMLWQQNANTWRVIKESDQTPRGGYFQLSNAGVFMGFDDNVNATTMTIQDLIIQITRARMTHTIAAAGSTPLYLALTQGTIAGNRAFQLGKEGDANGGWFIDFNGAMQWGPGGATATDTNLKRTAAGELGAESIKGLVSGSADAWHGMTLAGLWTNRGAGYPNLSYRKLASPANSVQITGQVKPNGSASGTTIATLPVGYRPTTNIAFECGSDSAGRALLEAQTDGQIVAYSSAFGLVVQINTLIPLDL